MCFLVKYNFGKTFFMKFMVMFIKCPDIMATYTEPKSQKANVFPCKIQFWQNILYEIHGHVY